MTPYQIPFGAADPSTTTPINGTTVLRSGILTAVQFSFFVSGGGGVDAINAGYLCLTRSAVDSSQLIGPITSVVANSAVASIAFDHAGTGQVSLASVSNLIPTAFRVNIGDIIYLMFFEFDTGAATHPKAYGYVTFFVND